MINEGKKAPAVSLKDQDGNKVSLNDFKGKNIVLYFYPKDNTSGCTKEACNFRDDFPDFKKLKAVILGISPDSIESHKKFADKFDLPFRLLKRSTFIIDKAGKVKKIFRKVKVADHNEEVMNALKDLE
jgi:peroxiredoxin Q/BCP